MSTVITPSRPMPPLPKQMQHLPIDKHGRPVPWFVQWIDGQPEFRVMDYKKFISAIRSKLCWVCGNPLREEGYCFVIGPMCAVNRVSSEPPSHPECARFSAMACPFLSMPKMRRREDELTAKAVTAGVAIKRNPGVALLWFCRDYRLEKDGKGGILFRIGKAVAAEWYCEGRPATRAEVMHSIDTGMPILRDMAAQDGPEALEQLREDLGKAVKLLPKE